MTVGWIAEHLVMRTRGYLNHLLYRRRKLGGYLPISRTDPFAPLRILHPVLDRARHLNPAYSRAISVGSGTPVLSWSSQIALPLVVSAWSSRR
jgi:hypothetical protein